jgi:hypothetical protein
MRWNQTKDGAELLRFKKKCINNVIIIYESFRHIAKSCKVFQYPSIHDTKRLKCFQMVVLIKCTE